MLRLRAKGERGRVCFCQFQTVDQGHYYAPKREEDGCPAQMRLCFQSNYWLRRIGANLQEADGECTNTGKPVQATGPTVTSPDRPVLGSGTHARCQHNPA